MFHIFIFEVGVANTFFNCFSDEAMEVHEDDSDSETMRTTEGVLEKLDSDATQTERQQLNDTDNSYLDSVDFSWLKDYFK